MEGRDLAEFGKNASQKTHYMWAENNKSEVTLKTWKTVLLIQTLKKRKIEYKIRVQHNVFEPSLSL